MRIFSFVILIFLSSSAISFAQNRDETVIVRGRRIESRIDRKTGQSVLVTPEDASRFESTGFLKRESSVIAPETGRISPSGFTIPKIRGQDVKLTDVFLEDIQLQEPYSGLPLIEDLDLRAFGAMEIHQGLPPPDVPGLNPIGILRYRFRHLTQSDAKVGFQTGRPFGLSAWGLGQFVKGEEDSENGDRKEIRIYARHHQSNGKYKYYSDEGTPYNRYDDALKIRSNNDQRSMQTVPYFSQKFSNFKFDGLAWIYQAERGLPAMSMLVPSHTREEARGHLVNLNLENIQKDVAWFHEMKLKLGVTDSRDARMLNDKAQDYLGAGREGKLLVQSRRGRVKADVSSIYSDLYLNYETGVTEVRDAVDGKVAVDLQRQNTNASLGGSLFPHPLLTIEFKGSWRQHVDRQKLSQAVIILGGEETKERRKRESDAIGASVSVGEEHWGIYLQKARSSRLPSLIEEYGNGASIRGNTKIKPEAIHHEEAGLFLQNIGHWRLGSAVYQDRIEDRILFVPVLANAVKAQNIRETETTGIDLRAETSWNQTRVYLSASRLLPLDVTGTDKKILPAIPERVMVSELEQKVGAATLRWLARYRSEIYRDLANSVRLPSALVHDASVDYNLQWLDSSWQFGFSIKNVLNLMAVTIEAPDTPDNKGKTAYSDLAGAPLPGRQWILSVAATI